MTKIFIVPVKKVPSDMPTIQSRRASQIIPMPIAWLWEPHFALGKFSMIVGDPGLGKSTLTAAFAAHITKGKNWPDGMPCISGEVLLVNAEDDPSDTTRPRLDAAGADPHGVHILDSVSDLENGGFKSFNLQNVDAIDDFITRNPDVRLVIIDPISAYLAGVDSHRNSDVRSLLSPIAALAAKWSIAIIGVSHLNKGQAAAIYRSSGSLAFVAAARSVYLLAKSEDSAEKRVLIPVKNNLGPDTHGIAYRLLANDSKVPYVEWLDEKVQISADQLLSQDHRENISATEECMEWLEPLFNGEVLIAADVIKLAEGNGFSSKTLRMARKKLGVKTVKSSMDGGWLWSLDDIADGDSK